MSEIVNQHRINRQTQYDSQTGICAPENKQEFPVVPGIFNAKFEDFNNFHEALPNIIIAFWNQKKTLIASDSEPQY